MKAIFGLVDAPRRRDRRARSVSPRDDLLTTLVRRQRRRRAQPRGGGRVRRPAAVRRHGDHHQPDRQRRWALLAHPDELQAVLDDPEPASRRCSRRRCGGSRPCSTCSAGPRCPFERHGDELPADATVTLLLGAANRDPRHWGDDADEFRPDRSFGGHVSFGFGAALLSRRGARPGRGDVVGDAPPAPARRDAGRTRAATTTSTRCSSVADGGW